MFNLIEVIVWEFVRRCGVQICLLVNLSQFFHFRLPGSLTLTPVLSVRKWKIKHIILVKHIFSATTEHNPIWSCYGWKMQWEWICAFALLLWISSVLDFYIFTTRTATFWQHNQWVHWNVLSKPLLRRQKTGIIQFKLSRKWNLNFDNNKNIKNVVFEYAAIWWRWRMVSAVLQCSMLLLSFRIIQ